MSEKFNEYKGLNLSQIGVDMLEAWTKENTFNKSIELREGEPTFVFYEGPPSANGKPGIHHVMARTLKDVFCRYKTQKGYLVHRKAGWDTHGLPVELGVEKKLGITKEDIGSKISIKDYNQYCRTEVMTYTGLWKTLTEKMGYWVNMDDPYITYDNKYIETLWWMLKELYSKGLLYKGFTIQPYSPAAGTGLSNHELNQPGCYRDVKDTTCTAQFKIVRDAKSEHLFAGAEGNLYFLAWTTTPWTLPSNTALCVGPTIKYVKVKSYNPYTAEKETIIMAKDLVSNLFPDKNKELLMADYNGDGKNIPFETMEEYVGSELKGINYEQLIPWVKPDGDAFRVITGDFVTTEDGTGIVHIAPTFGADDDRVAKVSGIAHMTLIDKAGKVVPMVDRTGKFFLLSDLDTDFVSKFINVDLYKEYEGRFVKNAYDESLTQTDTTLDIDMCVMLKSQNLVFKIEKHVHNYPHCWRTDKPVLYYPLDSWFIKTTAFKDELLELNKTINWKPQSTGTGRFGKWLENLVDWNLSRSRYWGTPLPIWATEDHSELKCIGSISELYDEIELSIKAGKMTENPLKGYIKGNYSKENYTLLDLHRPYVDQIILVSASGETMRREADLIDVWFDSGAMPYAQVHYPFEISKEEFNKVYPADFIAEGVDQTRGWFFTLHALSTMLFNSVAFKNIISNGLVLDKNGNKMSKRLGNTVDPFEVIDTYGPDAVRMYMMANSQPWDNLRFDLEGVDEMRRKFFGTLYNTYSFFSLYANVDNFKGNEPQVPMSERPEIDRWIISLLNTLVKDVDGYLSSYDPTPAARAITEFVGENLSNWYVRLNRKRFWGGSMTTDKLAAFQTLYTCIDTVVKVAAPFAPFITDRIYRDLNAVSGLDRAESVHLTNFPTCNESLVCKELERRMDIAERISSMILALRRKVNIRVRQPLQKIMIPLLNISLKEDIEMVKNLILTEVNVKDLEYIEDTTGIMVKRIKPNFKTLGPKYGKQMKQIGAVVGAFTQHDITELERNEKINITVGEEILPLTIEDFDITTEDMPGWLVITEGKLTVALDITINDTLRQEGIAREFVNRIQNLRKDAGFDVTDKINVRIEKDDTINDAINQFKNYIASQTLAKSIELEDSIVNKFEVIEIDEISYKITVDKI
ncbi:MAG: isoleucine--tRNA ligase [Rikenellaceae bacterium]